MTAAGPDRGEETAALGIHRITLPTPFGLPVHCYLIEDDPPTLFDTGTNSGEDLEALEAGLAALGHRVEDLERIVVTHHHHDHIGGLPELARRSGAQLWALDGLVDWMESYERNSLDSDAYIQDLLEMHGFPPGLRARLRQKARWYYAWAADVNIETRLSDGDIVPFASRELRVYHRPGHSLTDTVFVDADRKLMLGGDHLIANVAATPLINPPRSPQDPRPQSLVTYRDSMALTRAMDLSIVLSGHGPPILDHRGLVDRRIAQQDRRADALERLLLERPLTAFELTQVAWTRELTPTDLYLPFSEVLGHADLLRNAGRVREVHDDGGIVRFERA